MTALLITGAIAWAAIIRDPSKEESMTGERAIALASDISLDDLASVAHTPVFFGHQSVGMNILQGVRAVYAARGIPAPPIEEDGSKPGDDGGFIDHAFIGQNGKPLLKISDFDTRMRSGIGEQVDVAMMKFCYVDITSETNVGEVFARYRETMAALQRDFPDVSFVHATVPVMTDQGVLATLKSLLTGSSDSGPADNEARQLFNDMIRREYGGTHLFDLAAAESTAPDGTRAAGTYQGREYYRLFAGYAADSGHLNDEGSMVVATAWLRAIAQASPR